MKILYVITRADVIGGAQVHVLHLTTFLQSRGYEVTVASGRGCALARELFNRNIRHLTVESLGRAIDPLRDARALTCLADVIRDIRPDLLSAHSSKAGIIARLAGRLTGTPTLFTAHGWSFAEGVPRLPRYLYRQTERLIAPLTARLITVCQTDRSLALRYRLLEPERIVTIHNGVPDIPLSLRARPGQPDCRIVTVARLEPPKDLDTLLRALAAVTDLSWTLDIVGDGPLRAPLEKTAAHCNISDRVNFLGSVRDVAGALTNHDLFVLSSKWEGFPRTILEAMRAGLPVIASGVGGVAEAVQNKTSGLVVHSSDEWEVALRQVIASPSLRLDMGAHGRQRYLERFTLSRMADETLQVYEDVLTTFSPMT